MPTNVIYGDTHVAGTFTAEDMNVPDGSVGDDAVETGAEISANKLQQQVLGKLQAAVPAAQVQIVHVAKGAGEVNKVRWIAKTVPTTSTYTIDVKKNGTTILPGVVTITGASVAATDTTVTFNATTYVASDYFEIVLASFSGGSYGTGLLVEMMGREAPGV